MMTSFDCILPSNVAPDTYPDNTASDYTTPLTNPIHCDGQWEVGLKSIFYDSHVGDETEMGKISINHWQQKKFWLNDYYKVQYQTTKIDTWDYSSRIIPAFEPPSYKKVADVLNGMNERLVKKGCRNAYTCTVKENKIEFDTHVYGLTIRFRPKMAKFLGYGHKIFLHLSPDNKNTSTMRPIHEINQLTQDDFYMNIFDRYVVAMEGEVLLKTSREDLLTKEEFVKRWNERVGKHIKIKASFNNNKCILRLYDPKSAIVMSKNLHSTISHEPVMFGGGEYWGWKLYGENTEDYDITDRTWTVKIFKEPLRLTERYLHHSFDYELYPRIYSIPTFVSRLTKDLTKKLRELTEDTAAITFSLQDNFTKIEIPHQTTMVLSPNISSMLGFNDVIFKSKSPFENELNYGREDAQFMSQILPATLDKREQEIFVHTDVCDPMSYGNQQRRILQHFIHNKGKDEGIVEKWFKPIIYQPLMKQMMDSITMKLLNREGTPLPFHNKTIITLHFRKR